MATQPTDSNESHQLVFVYGTLKRGHQRSHALAGQTFIGPASTAADYRMFDLGDYPGLIEVEPGTGDQVQGEIYRVDQGCLRQLDQIEAVDQGLYERREIRIFQSFGTSGGLIAAYFYLGDIAGCNNCGACW